LEAVRTAMRWFADPFWGGPKPNLDTVFEVSLRWSGMHDGGPVMGKKARIASIAGASSATCTTVGSPTNFQGR